MNNFPNNWGLTSSFSETSTRLGKRGKYESSKKGKNSKGRGGKLPRFDLSSGEGSSCSTSYWSSAEDAAVNVKGKRGKDEHSKKGKNSKDGGGKLPRFDLPSGEGSSWSSIYWSSAEDAAVNIKRETVDTKTTAKKKKVPTATLR